MDPFEMLLRTHRRLEQRLTDLTRAADERDHQMIVDVLDYFERAITRHEADEEQSLFPRIPQLQSVCEAITAEHAHHAALHKKLREAAENVDWEALRTLTGEIASAYAGHITREENELFPAARAAG
jgi:hemerythrin-like domain-containing protein